ncbi:MAG: YhcN/YlaJ family sporulation lipoprotein [Christensenellales bacterium]
MKKWFLTLMCMLAASVVMVGCSANTMSTAPTASPMTTTAAPTNSPMATAEATAEPAPAATMEAMTPAQAGQLAEKIAQAVQQISEIDEAQVVVNNDRALVAVRFDAQYNAGLDDRMKQQITETVQKVDDGLKDVEITDDDTLYGQIKGLGERVASVTGLDELADDFGDLWIALSEDKRIQRERAPSGGAMPPDGETKNKRRRMTSAFSRFMRFHAVFCAPPDSNAGRTRR